MSQGGDVGRRRMSAAAHVTGAAIGTTPATWDGGCADMPCLGLP